MGSWEPMLERVVHERYPRLVTHAMLVAGSATDAQDLVQEALISTFSGRARFRSVEQAEAYVRRAIVSRAIDESRRRATESRTSQRVAGLPVPPVVVEERGPGADMLRALATLSPRERACVVLRQLDDLSVAETAAQLGLSEGAVKRYTADGIARLNAVLGSTASTAERMNVQQVDTQEVRHGK
ncbi:sigma-70 family RNA polymerase sigma factor [Cellulomonas sp. URHB0016]